MNIKSLLSKIILFAFPSTVLAQTDNLLLKQNITALGQYAAKYPTEKVHLHLDRQLYGLGDTIWFKGYVVTDGHHRPSTISGVLYAELINPGDTVVQRLTLVVNQGISKGDFALPYSYKSGNYRLRAYTRWMLNDSSYFYEQKLNIGGLNPEPGTASGNLSQVKPAAQHQTLLKPDVQFFPEGGELVNGLRSKVAFKITDRKGLALAAKGVIMDGDGNELIDFSTQRAGMGAFALTPVAGKRYKAKITLADSSCHEFDLPKALTKGFTLSVNAIDDSLLIKVAANDTMFRNNPNTSFYVIAQADGSCYYSASSKLSAPIFTTEIAKNRFPSGIVQFTLFSQNNEPLCERIVFVQNSEQLKLGLSSERQTYAPMQKVMIGLDAKNGGAKAVAGSFSISVTDETKVPVDEKAETTIFTDLLLTSELKGHIDNPNYYFINETDKTRLDLDLLMLTQGYRRFEWKKIQSGKAPAITYLPETALSLSGTITTFSNKPITNGKVRLTSIKDYLALDTLTDLRGNFRFTNLNLFDTTKVIINAKKAKGGDNVKIKINEPTYPAVETAPLANDYPVTEIPGTVFTAMKKTYLQDKYNSRKRPVQLKEVKIKSRRNEFFDPLLSDNIKYDGNLNGLGHADQIALGDNFIGCAKLSECLLTKLFGVTWSNGIPYSLRVSHISGNSAMGVFIDGSQVSANELDSINPYDVYSVEALTSISYLSIYGSNAPNGALLITLRHGSTYRPELITVDGLITYNFIGYYKAREFYSPKYDTKNTATITDDRKTIYWNPDIITDANGKATFEYFNAGSKGTYRVVVEGIDGYGNLGRQVFRYKVE